MLSRAMEEKYLTSSLLENVSSTKTALSPYNPSNRVKWDIEEGRESHVGKKVTIYDTTLRDGEQAPGLRFTLEQKVAIAKKLDEAGVPEIEAGFPPVSPTERETVKTIAGLGLSAKVLVLCRALKEDVEMARECGAQFLLMFVPGSERLARIKKGVPPQSLVEPLREAVQLAKDYGISCSFSTEDTTRMDISSLRTLYGAAKQMGVTRMGITDTAGCATPEAVGFLVKELRKLGPREISIHCHNDFGLAVANSLAGVLAGGTHVACTVNGIGERGGNTALEQFVMSSELLYGIHTGVRMGFLKELSHMVERVCGRPLPPNQPVVGSFAFAHESGMHIHAQLKDPRCYEPYDPEMVGGRRVYLLGKHTGKAAVKALLIKNGLISPDDPRLTEGILEEMVMAVKSAAEKGENVDEDFLKALLKNL